MALTDDQRAMLRLLAQRDEGYEDIAALMGLSVDEVRARVKEALDQLAADEAAAEAPPAPKPVPEPQAPPPPPPPKPEPPPSEPAEGKAAPAPKAPSRPSPSPQIPLPADRRGWAIVAGGAAIVVILLVLLATGAFSGGSDSSSTASDGSATSTTASNANSSGNLTQAILTPVNGGDAAGRALFGRVRKAAVLEVIAKGLEPSPQGHSYTVWLYRSPKVSLRIGGVRVGKSGGIAAQFPIPAQLLAYVANGAFDQIDISLTDDAAYKAEVAQAKKQNRLPRYSGTDVLRGKIIGPGVKPTAGG